MKTTGLFALGCTWLIVVGTATAGLAPSTGKSVAAPTKPTEANQLDVLECDGSYVFTSPIKFAHERLAAGDEVHSEFRYLRRFPIRGNWYLQAGIDYESFEFGGSTAAGPLPGALQTVNAPIGIVYLVGNEIGFLAQVRPGVNFEHHVDRGAFDIPVEVGSDWPIIKDKLYLSYGLATSILREYPVLPHLGLVWLINKKWTLYGVAPEPRLMYTCSDRLTVWAGGEVLAQSFKTDPTNAVFAPNDRSTSGSVVDYTEIRAGVGATFTPVDNWDINFAAGYAVEREFNFYRANKCYSADPAPYVRVQLKASF